MLLIIRKMSRQTDMFKLLIGTLHVHLNSIGISFQMVSAITLLYTAARGTDIDNDYRITQGSPSFPCFRPVSPAMIAQWAGGRWKHAHAISGANPGRRSPVGMQTSYFWCSFRPRSGSPRLTGKSGRWQGSPWARWTSHLGLIWPPGHRLVTPV